MVNPSSNLNKGLSNKVCTIDYCTIGGDQCGLWYVGFWLEDLNKHIRSNKEVNTLSYRTISANAQTATKEWIVVDAEGQQLGRLCSKVAKLLRGKYKPNFTPHVDCGDNVIIINADKIRLSGNKWEGREYIRFTGYPGGQRFYTPRDLQQKGSTYLFRKVVKGMLPKNKLSDRLLNNMYVYDGPEHKHEAQKPRLVDLNEIM